MSLSHSSVETTLSCDRKSESQISCRLDWLLQRLSGHLGRGQLFRADMWIKILYLNCGRKYAKNKQTTKPTTKKKPNQQNICKKGDRRAPSQRHSCKHYVTLWDLYLSANHGTFVSEPPEPSICITLEGKMLWLATAAEEPNRQRNTCPWLLHKAERITFRKPLGRCQLLQKLHSSCATSTGSCMGEVTCWGGSAE